VKLWDPLALREMSALLRDPVFRGRGVPRGDGRPVLLIPGFLSGDWSLTVMFNWLERIGYKAHLSGILFNVLDSERLLAGLRHRVAQIEAGAEVVQLFDSWAGILPEPAFERWVI